MDFKTMKFEQIVEWCKANNQTAWLKEQFANESPSYVIVKRAFCAKFMPELLPKAKSEKKPSMKDIVAAL